MKKERPGVGYVNDFSRTSLKDCSKIETCDYIEQDHSKEIPLQSSEQQKCIEAASLHRRKDIIYSQKEMNHVRNLRSHKKPPKPSQEYKKIYFKIIALTFFVLVNVNFFLNLDYEEFEALRTMDEETEALYNHHNYHHYQINLESNVRRGMNIINAWSGCDIAAWVFNSNYGEGCCNQKRQQNKRINHKKNIEKMRDGDTVFVPFTSLNDFSLRILPKIKTEFVLITSELDYHIETVSESIQNVSMPRILNNSKLLHWFSRDVKLMLGVTPNSSVLNEKISSFPVGLKPDQHWKAHRILHFNPIPIYQKAFIDLTPKIGKKTNLLYYGYLQTYDEVKSRNKVPRTRYVEYPEYLAKIAESQYLLSPNGKKPDCHRHYEAIGLGTVPITELDPVYYRHVKNSPIVFKNTIWKLKKLTRKLSNEALLLNNSVRNMVFEEYYMEYVEDVVGRPLRWWDVHQSYWSLMKNFVDAPYSFWNETMNRSLEETLSILLDS